MENNIAEAAMFIPTLHGPAVLADSAVDVLINYLDEQGGDDGWLADAAGQLSGVDWTPTWVIPVRPTVAIVV